MAKDTLIKHLKPSTMNRSNKVDMFSMLKSYVNKVKNHLVAKYSESIF